MALQIDATWMRSGGPSRFRTWNVSLWKLEDWLRQKKYPYSAANMATRFMKKYGTPGSLTDAYILAAQNFKEWRQFVNEYHKNKTA